MRTIYIIGPLTPRGARPDTNNAAIEYLMNVRDFIVAAVALIKKGWAPFCAGLDFQYFLSLGPWATLSEQEIKDMSMAWLDRSDACVLLPRWETSMGSQAEYRRAVELEMTIYETLESVPHDK